MVFEFGLGLPNLDGQLCPPKNVWFATNMVNNKSAQIISCTKINHVFVLFRLELCTHQNLLAFPIPNSFLKLLWSHSWHSFEMSRISPILDVQGPDYFFHVFFTPPPLVQGMGKPRLSGQILWRYNLDLFPICSSGMAFILSHSPFLHGDCTGASAQPGCVPCGGEPLEGVGSLGGWEHMTKWLAS